MRAALALLLATPLACGDAPSLPQAPPVRPLAAVSIEPPTLRIGDVATVEIGTLLPAGFRALPYQPPAVPEVWLLDTKTLETQRDGARWIHRTRIRIRPRSLGRFEWPASRLEIESPEGLRRELEVPGRTFEVVSVLPAVPERVEPFPLRSFTERGASRGSRTGLAALAGAAATLLAVALASWWRRRRRASVMRTPEHEGDTEGEKSDLQLWALREVSSARKSMEADPLAAACAGAQLLRRYLALRFRADVAASTTPELEAARPPLALTSSWPHFVRILRALDEARFGVPAGDSADLRERIGAALAEIERFVEHTGAPGSRAR